MQEDRQLISRVRAAQESMERADELISSYLPFIRAEASRCLGRVCGQQDDELSIAMIAFHEAIRGYAPERGAFLKYAALLIRSRLIDFQRREARHRGHLSLDAASDDEQPLGQRLADGRDHYSQAAEVDATRQELAELSRVMSEFGLSLTDVAENSPKQERTLTACRQAVSCARANPDLLDQLLRTKKLPLAQLAAGAGVERKTLERHRKYILALLLIQTNGYDIIRGHLRQMFNEKGGPSA